MTGVPDAYPPPTATPTPRSSAKSRFVYVAFVVDVFAQRILAWHASTNKRTQLVLTLKRPGVVGGGFVWFSAGPASAPR